MLLRAGLHCQLNIFSFCLLPPVITWATFPFVRYTPALIAGIVACLYFGEGWPELWPYAAALAVLAVGVIYWAVGQRRPAVFAARTDRRPS